MSATQRLFGQSLFWLSTPLIRLYLRGSQRTRIAVICGNEVLVVQSWLGNGHWMLPGGGRHKKESAEAGALRELYEEVGIRAQRKDLTFVGGFQMSTDFNYHYDLFTLRASRKPILRLQRLEIAEARWLNVRELSQMKHSDELDELVSRLGKHGLVSTDLLQ
jgi:8-oxo-dGTP pyrophosphatase MutT (NUDIX family)